MLRARPHRPSTTTETTIRATRPGILRIFLVFLNAGATVFGGMWAATQKLEKLLVRRTGWLRTEELRTSLVLATLIPAPKFMGFSGLVGFKMGGWLGAFVAIIGLLLPASAMVLAAVSFVQPQLLGGPLTPLMRAIGIAVVGLLFGNAYHQMRDADVSRRSRVVGLALSLTLFGAIVAGVPLIAAAFVGFAAGAVLIRDRSAQPEITEEEVP